MTNRYRGAVGVFALSLATVAAIIGLVTPGVGALPLVLFALSAYGVAVLLDVLPPGRPTGASQDDDADSGGPGGLLAASQPAPRSTVETAAAGALGGVAVLMVVVTGFAALQRGDTDLSEQYVADFAVPTDSPPTVPAGGHIATNPVETETPAPTVEPTATPSPSPAPTSTATAVPTPQVPDSPFTYCTHLGGSRYSCGDQPWRVICSPDGYFFDPEGTVRNPIPDDWEGWSETTLTERLEYIHGVCEGP